MPAQAGGTCVVSRKPIDQDAIAGLDLRYVAANLLDYTGTLPDTVSLSVHFDVLKVFCQGWVFPY